MALRVCGRLGSSRPSGALLRRGLALSLLLWAQTLLCLPRLLLVGVPSIHERGPSTFSATSSSSLLLHLLPSFRPCSLPIPHALRGLICLLRIHGHPLHPLSLRALPCPWRRCPCRLLPLPGLLRPPIGGRLLRGPSGKEPGCPPVVLVAAPPIVAVCGRQARLDDGLKHHLNWGRGPWPLGVLVAAVGPIGAEAILVPGARVQGQRRRKEAGPSPTTAAARGRAEKVPQERGFLSIL